MQQIPLSAIPNQSFTIRLNNIRWGITLQLCEGIMSATITRNDIPVVSGARCVAGFPLINYRSSEDLKGNFVFSTLNDELPMYTLFGTTQFLYYATQEEIEVFRGGQ